LSGVVGARREGGACVVGEVAAVVVGVDAVGASGGVARLLLEKTPAAASTPSRHTTASSATSATLRSRNRPTGSGRRLDAAGAAVVQSSTSLLDA